MKPISVVKRDGSKEILDLEKIQTQIARACDGISDVSPSMIELTAKIQFIDGMTTLEIDQLLLRAMVDLIDMEQNPETAHVNYQYVAGRQRLRMLRKDVYGGYDPRRLYDIVVENVLQGVYTRDLLTWYTEEEWDTIDSFVNHKKDEAYAFSSLEQLIEKYLVQNRVTKQVYETPQVRYAVAAATAFHNEKSEKRMKYVRDYYACSSDGLFTLATPVLAGLGTNTKQFSSCVLLTAGDSLDSIFATGEMMAKYAAKRAGIGLEIGKIRAIDAPIRGGEIKHTGLVPFLKKWFGDLRSCCLRPDMLVEIETETGSDYIQIANVTDGMKVRTQDRDGNLVFRQVTDVFITEVPKEDQVRIEFENNTVLECSTNHPIMVLRNDLVVEVMPPELTTGDQVVTVTGTTTLRNIEIGRDNDKTYVDITVDEDHTFFTTADRYSDPILTHNSQGGIRNASCTVNLPIWHYQFEDYIVLKNNQGTDETRVRHLDYSVVLNAFFFRRLKNGQNITFFDPVDVPDLLTAFYSDTAEFERLYALYEKRTDIRMKAYPASTVFKDWILKERTDTGRIYLLFIDNVISQTPFDVSQDPIVQSNLCVTGDTEIDVMINGTASRVPILDIIDRHHEEILVKSKNVDTGEVSYQRIVDSALTGYADELIVVQDVLSGHSFKCTPDHQVYTSNRGYVEAQYLKETDKLDLNIKGATIESKLRIERVTVDNIPVYDITVKGNHNFYANNILAHNCHEILLPTKPFERIESTRRVIKIRKDQSAEFEKQFRRSNSTIKRITTK